MGENRTLPQNSVSQPFGLQFERGDNLNLITVYTFV